MSEEEKVYWLRNSVEGKPYGKTTWYRCPGLQKFLDKVEEQNVIVGIVASGNNIGFILEDKQ